MFKKMKKPRYMMATKAFHQLGEISREEPDYCYVDHETKGFYRGAWIEGFGFVCVKFPKETTFELTEEQQEHIDNSTFVIV